MSILLTESKLFCSLSQSNQILANKCMGFVIDIWGANPLIHNFTDHGPEHSLRILDYVEEMLGGNLYDLNADERLVLLLGIILHDIGMQCDLRKKPYVKSKAESRFHCSFSQDYAENAKFNVAHELEVRKSHHLLSAAWIEFASTNNSDDLHAVLHGSDYLCEITANGWMHISELRKTENEINQGFIAMAFKPETEEIGRHTPTLKTPPCP